MRAVHKQPQSTSHTSPTSHEPRARAPRATAALADAHARQSHRSASLPGEPGHALTRTGRANAPTQASTARRVVTPPARMGARRSSAGPRARRLPVRTTRFAHHRLDAFHVAKSALVAGDAIARKLPRGYGTLADQLRRALLGAYLNLTEAAARDGNDRRQRFRCARAECNEAAAALEAAVAS